MPSYPDYLACPIDGTVLGVQGRQLCCAQGHHFDIARQGYVNLLPVQQKKSKQPGDNKDMVTARAAFLNTHTFQPIAQQLQHTLENLLADKTHHYCVLDAGCGDGYYLNQLAQTIHHPFISWIGVDISKFAVMAAAKRNASIVWLVSSNKQLPVLPKKVDVILSVFGFPNALGFENALASDGYVVLVEPGEQHLIELRELLYAEVKQPADKNNAEALLDTFRIVNTQSLRYQTKALHNNELVNLLKMTPHFYRAPKDAVERVCQQDNIIVTVDVTITQLTCNTVSVC